MRTEEKFLQVRLERFLSFHHQVCGSLYVGDEYCCDTLENELHELPVGEYEITIEHSDKLHRVLPTVDGHVPFMSGNGTFGRRQGCIVLGEMRLCGLVVNSEENFNRFNWRMRQQINRYHHKVIIRITESEDFQELG